jgi:hypothetical protein
MAKRAATIRLDVGKYREEPFLSYPETWTFHADPTSLVYSSCLGMLDAGSICILTGDKMRTPST